MKCKICNQEFNSESSVYCDRCDTDIKILTYGSTIRRDALKKLLSRIRGDKIEQ